MRSACLFLGILAGSVSASPSTATLVVTDASDSGAGSLRQAILDSNASVGVTDTITFAIPGPGPHTIALVTALPEVTDPVTIDGTTQPGYAGIPLIEVNGAAIAAPNAVLTLSAGNTLVSGLALNRGPDAGIRVKSSDQTRIYQAFIGTDSTGTVDLGNASHGIVIENSTFTYIGDPFTNAQRCVISGNGGHGVYAVGASTANGFISYARIGTDPAEQRPLGNDGWGVFTDSSYVSMQNSTIANNGAGGWGIGAAVIETGIERSVISSNGGPGISAGSGTNHVHANNTIANNSGPGVTVAPSTTGLRLLENVIYGNGGLGIDLGGDGRTPNDPGDVDTGANNLPNFPVLRGVVVGASGDTLTVQIEGRLEAAPSTTYVVTLYAGGPGRTADDPQATVILGSIPALVTDGAGTASFSFTANLPAGARFVTATVTDPGNNTSELAVPLGFPDIVIDSCGLLGVEALLLLGLLGGVRPRR